MAGTELISREDATLAIARVPTETSRDIGLINDCLNILNELPSAERTGHWIFNPIDAIELMFAKPKCSECGFESADGGNYCSNCGARMVSEDAE